MYIPTWFISIIIVVSIYLYIQSKKKSSNLKTRDQRPKTEDMWDQAQLNMARVLEKSPLIEKYLKDEREMVNAMEKDMIRLREHYKHDAQKQNEIARDWMDYSNAVAEIKWAREMLDVDMDNNAYDSYDERTKEVYIIIQEIYERVEKELGKVSVSRLVHDRLRKKSNEL